VSASPCSSNDPEPVRRIAASESLMLTRSLATTATFGALCLLSLTSLACAEGKKTATTTAGAAASGTAAAPGTASSTGKPATTEGAQNTASLATTGGDELVVLQTSAGEVVIDLFEDKTPGHAENFKKLVRQ